MKIGYVRYSSKLQSTACPKVLEDISSRAKIIGIIVTIFVSDRKNSSYELCQAINYRKHGIYAVCVNVSKV